MSTTKTEIAQFQALPQTVRDTALAYRAKAIADAESAGVSVEDQLRSLIGSTVTLESEALRHAQSDFTPEDGRAYWQSESQRLFAQRIALAMDVVDPAHVRRAVQHLDATRLADGDYAYYADEVSAWYRVSEADVADLGRMLAEKDACEVPDCKDEHHDAYSHWCAGCGQEITDAETLAALE